MGLCSSKEAAAPAPVAKEEAKVEVAAPIVPDAPVEPSSPHDVMLMRECLH